MAATFALNATAGCITSAPNTTAWAKRSCVEGAASFPENPPVEAVCLACGARTTAEDLISAEVFSYVLTPRGAQAIRRGSLLGGDDEPVSIADAPVY